MIQLTSIDAAPGEVELLNLMTAYVMGRLFTPKQRKTLEIYIDVTRQAVRVPVSRQMFAPQKAGLGTKRPTSFEMTVSTAAGIRDAAEVITHELLHISQVANNRLEFTRKKKKINRQKVVVDCARWMGGKPIVIDELDWMHRPWEIEACHWQRELVTEFLLLSTGQQIHQPRQKPTKKKLALYAVDMPAPQAAPHSNGPDFAPQTAAAHSPENAPQADATGNYNVNGTVATGTMPAATAGVTPDLKGTGGSRLAQNGASIDAILASQTGETAVAAATATASAASNTDTNTDTDTDLSDAALEAVFGLPDPTFGAVSARLEDEDGDQLPPASSDPASDPAEIAADPAISVNDPIMVALAAEIDAKTQGETGETGETGGSAGVGLPTPPEADNGADVSEAMVQAFDDLEDFEDGDDDLIGYPMPEGMMEVDVPGLETPRQLDATILAAKLRDFEQRGLAAIGIDAGTHPS